MKSEDKFYVITQAIDSHAGEYLVSVGYTFNPAMVEEYFRTLRDDYMDGSCIVEEFNESELASVLDLYDMEQHAFELQMITDKYDPSNRVIITDAILQSLEYNDPTGDIIRDAMESYFKLDKLLSLSSCKKQLEPTLNKLREYMILYRLSDTVSSELLPELFKPLGFPKEVLDEFEDKGLDHLINIVNYYKHSDLSGGVHV